MNWFTVWMDRLQRRRTGRYGQPIDGPDIAELVSASVKTGVPYSVLTAPLRCEECGSLKPAHKDTCSRGEK